VTFVQNNAGQDALIDMETNSVMYVSNSEFVENFSIGRGSVLFAEYQAVQAFFSNCTMMRNYAYQGGIFYIQYSSSVYFTNSTLVENFAVIGGAAYVNNDGKLVLAANTTAANNSALNSCFLFLINTQYESLVQDSLVMQNDQSSSIIQKEQFLSYNASNGF